MTLRLYTLRLLHSIGDKTLPAAREAAIKAKKRLLAEEKR
jgi:hypothetical protein